MGVGQYYIQHYLPNPTVLALEITNFSPTLTPEPTFTPTPTETPTPEPTPTNTPKPTRTPTPKPTITPTATSTIIVTPTPRPSPTASAGAATSSPVATITTTVSLILAPSWMEGWFTQYANEYHTDANLLKKIADCESSFGPGAQSKNGDYGGMFQFTIGTWQSNRMAMGLDPNPSLRFGAQESIQTAAYLLAHTGPGAWPVCSK